MRLEKDRSKVLRTLRRVNAQYHRIKAMEQEAIERKGLLLKDLDKYESDLILAQNDEDGDVAVGSLGRGMEKGKSKMRTCSGPSCRRHLERVSDELRAPRIFVYDLPRRFNKELSKKYKRCITDQYGTEVSQLDHCPCGAPSRRRRLLI